MSGLWDGHAHLGTEEERRFREREGIVTMICAGDGREAEELDRITGGWAVKACGLHPWNADPEALKDMEPWLEKADIIGEIGMDSVWCRTDLKVQREVFARQLELAGRRRKPVVLHVKGMEREAARMIRRYPGRYLVHWYSDPEWLDLYLEQDCYFTVGPDAGHNPAVLQVIRRVPLSRLMVETDGLGAVRWAMGREIPVEGVKTVLENSLRQIAGERGLEPEEAYRLAEENFRRFAGI